MNKNEVIRAVQKFLDNTCNQKEFEIFTEFMKTPGAKLQIVKWIEEGVIVDNTSDPDEDVENELVSDEKSATRKEKIMAALFRQENVVPFNGTRKSSKPHFSIFIKVAAIVIFAIGVVWISFNYIDGLGIKDTTTLQKQTLRGQKATITLSDGTTVQMNSESPLTYPREFGDSREVTLKGEAFFMVKRDTKKPFIVKTGNLETRVLGTSFNVNSFGDEIIKVTVETGYVKVSPLVTPPAGGVTEGDAGEQGSAGITLSPNQQAIFNTTTSALEKREVNATDFILWKSGILKFDHVKLREAIKTLERWYGVNISVLDPRLHNCKIVGESHNESLEAILKSFEYTLDITYEFDKDGIRLSGSGCEEN